MCLNIDDTMPEADDLTADDLDQVAPSTAGTGRDGTPVTPDRVLNNNLLGRFRLAEYLVDRSSR